VGVLFVIFTGHIPIKRRFIACSPLLSQINISACLSGIEHVTVNGESGREARECDYNWVLSIREQCVKAGVTFWFKSTVSLFKRDGITQKVNPFKQTSLAKDQNINIMDGKKFF
jgi:protein gp37